MSPAEPDPPWLRASNAGEVDANGYIQTTEPGILVRSGTIWVTSEQADKAAWFGWKRTGVSAYRGALVQVERR